MASSPSFPVDIYNLIFSYLPQKCLLQCRLVDKFVGSIATAWAFRHIRLAAVHGPSNFIHVVESDHLRHLVKEVTIALWTDSKFRNSHFRYWGNPIIQPHTPLFLALPSLRLFRNLKTLNIRFDDGDDDYLHDFRNSFRCYVLSTVFACLAGTWSAEWQKQLGHDLDIENDLTTLRHPNGHSGGDENCQGPSDPIELKTLTVSHLESFNDTRVTSLEAFKQVIGSFSLTELKLLVTTEASTELALTSTYQETTYQFLETLPSTWLSPALAQNLRVLSLYCTEYWGWDPKMDFRTVNPSIDSSSGFPNLKVLALGNYVFSHQWQVDWIASLGVNNGSGGLQELYLDDCPIMWFARMKGSPDTTDTICSTVDGPEIRFSNSGYPQREAMLTGPLNFHLDSTEIYFELRWHYVLSQWKDTMTSLKKFQMGHGAGWRGNEVWPPVLLPEVESLEDYERNYGSRIRGSVFLNYDSPKPPEGRIGLDDLVQGVGLHQKREHLMQYVYFDIAASPGWVEKDNRRQMIDDERIMDYESERRLSEETLRVLLDTIQARNKGI